MSNSEPQAGEQDEFAFAASKFFDFEEEDLPTENVDGYFSKRRSSVYSGRHSLDQQAGDAAAERADARPQEGVEDADVGPQVVDAEVAPAPEPESAAPAPDEGNKVEPPSAPQTAGPVPAGDAAPQPAEDSNARSAPAPAAPLPDAPDMAVEGQSVNVQRHSDVLETVHGAQAVGHEPSVPRPTTPATRTSTERLSFSAPRTKPADTASNVPDTARTTPTGPDDTASLASADCESLSMAPPPAIANGATARPAPNVRSTAASRAHAAAAARRAGRSTDSSAPDTPTGGRVRRPSALDVSEAAEAPSTPCGRQPRYMLGTAASRSRSRTRARPEAPHAVGEGMEGASPAGLRGRPASRSRTPSQSRPGSSASRQSSRARSRPRARSTSRSGATPSFMRPTSAWSSREKQQEEEAQRKAKEQEEQEREKEHLVASPSPLTAPQSPRFHYRPREDGPRMSSTTRELQRIRQEREELAAKRAQTKRAFHAALRPNPTAGGPIRSTRTLTVPEAFSFRTDARLRNAKPEQEASAHGPAAKQAAAAPPANQDSGATLTAPEPFQFRTEVRATSRQRERPEGESSASGTYHSMAEGVQAFTRTPKRFHTKPRTQDMPEPPTPTEAKLTEPKPFRFVTDTRIGRSTAEAVRSRDEQEEEFMKGIKPFKARAVDPRILASSGDVGVPRVPKPQLTEPHAFTFHSTAARRPSVKSQEELDAEEMQKQFKARPWNMDMYTKAAAGPAMPPPSRELTEPKSPQLATKGRSRSHSLASAHESESTSSLASATKVVPAGPFHLRSLERHEQAQAEFERKQEEERRKAEEATRFKARPVPDYSMQPPSLGGSVERRVLTEPVYDGPSQERHLEAQRRFEERRRREEEEKMEAAKFHARPAPSSLQRPSFMPRRSTQPLTEAAPFKLFSDRRAEERTEFDERQRQREAELAKMKEEQERERQQQEEEEVRHLRKQMTFKARPVPRPGAFMPRPSNRKPTSAKQPLLGAEERTQAGGMEAPAEM